MRVDPQGPREAWQAEREDEHSGKGEQQGRDSEVDTGWGAGEQGVGFEMPGLPGLGMDGGCFPCGLEGGHISS